MAGATVKRDEPTSKLPPGRGARSRATLRHGENCAHRVTVIAVPDFLHSCGAGRVVRTRFMLAVGAVCAACHGQPGPAFTGESLLALPPEAEAAHDELLHADITRGDTVRRKGLSDGFAAAFADDAVYLRGGLPILRGNRAIRAVIAAESAGAGIAIRWQPVRAEVSRDRASGYTYGYAVLAHTGEESSLRVDRYIAFWRKGAAGWRIAGYAETYGAPRTSSAP